MELGDPFPSARAFKTLLCSISNKGQLQKLTNLAQNVDAEIVYSVGPHCTNLSTQQVALLSLMPLIPIPMSRQRSSHSSCPV